MTSGPGRWYLYVLAAFVFLGLERLPAQTPLDAGTGQYVQQRWESGQGLPNDSIESILQTHDGYLWIATERGLSRFDGSHFQTFSHQTAPALKENYVSALFESRDGTLWIGTALNGLVTYKEGAFTTVPLPVYGLQGKVTVIREDQQGSIWIGTTSHGLFRLWKGHVESVGHAEGLDTQAVHGFAVDPQGTVWIAPDSGGLESWDGRRFVSRVPAAGFHGLPVRTLFADRLGTLWIASGDTVYSLSPSHEGASLRQIAVSHGPIRSLYATSDASGANELWIGTETAGLELHRNGQTTNFDAEHGFDIDTVQQILVDREGSLWVATDGFGLVQLRLATFRTFTDKADFPDYDIRALARGTGASFWIGTGKGLSRYMDGQIHPYLLTNKIVDPDFRSLLEDHDGTLWIGTDGGGVLRVKRGEHRADAVKIALPSQVVMALAEDTRKHIWIGTTGGLVEVAGTQTRTYTTADGLPSDVVLALLADRTGQLWIGTPQGLASAKDGNLRQYTMADGISSDTMTSLYEDRQGEVWIGAIDGLYHAKPRGFDHWTTDAGLFSNMVSDILEGNHGDLWIRSNSEISRVNRSDLLHSPAHGLRATKYDAEDGILKTVGGGGFPGSVSLPDGTLWFSSHKGLISVDTEHMGTAACRRRSPSASFCWMARPFL